MKIAMIGAGSVVFSKNLTGDLLHYPEFRDATFSYMDVDAERLKVGANLCRKVAKALGANPTIEETQDRRAALSGADFVICMVQIGGFNSTLVDFEIPRKYGLNITIGDTTGPAGVARALRTFPFMRDLARDIRDVASPDCWLLNYSNPMSANMTTIARTSGDPTTGRGGINAVGLCHSVQGTFGEIMRAIGVDPGRAHFECSGINHMAFFTKLMLDGEDLYPRLFAAADEKIAKKENAVRFELMKRLGYFVTESSEHHAEYSAHFIPHAGQVEKYKVPIDEYLRRCDGIVDEFDRLIDFSRSDEPIEVKRSHEYGSVIAHAVATGEPAVVYGNMLNDGAIPNLPPTAIVETPTLVDRNGCRLTRVGPVEPQLLSYMMPHVVQHELFIRAAVEGRRDHFYQAAMADPLTAAVLTPDKIVEMCDELIAAHGFEKDGGTLPDLDRTPTRVPGSGKSFSPPTPQALRESWEQAKQHTSDEDVLERWHVAGPLPESGSGPAIGAAVERYRSGGEPVTAAPVGANGDSVGWTAAAASADDRVEPMEAVGRSARGRFLAYAEFDSTHARTAPFRVSGPHMKLHVNGREVFDGGNGQVTVELREGKNTVLAELHSGRPFAVYVRKPNF